MFNHQIFPVQYIPFLLSFFLPDSSVFAQVQADTSLIQHHLRFISQTDDFRHHANPNRLNEVAAYLHAAFAQYSQSVSYQPFTVDGTEYKNVIATFGPPDAPRIIVGAHYDVCGHQQGADDNASGTVGLLELARMLQGQSLQHRIDLVAYTLEEPPYFRTQHMGSFVHARSLKEEDAEVLGMVCLEMIGFFKDEKGSQTYPLKPLALIYGKKGNYITLVRKFGAGRFARRFCRKYKRSRSIRTKTFTAPAKLQGIDFSDHRNYWHFGFSALMITDTAFFRNPHYHEKTDVIETLDIPRMARVIEGVFLSLVKLAAA
ncbi:MAG: M28 family peptidase [Bacteroidota bacterium]